VGLQQTNSRANAKMQYRLPDAVLRGCCPEALSTQNHQVADRVRHLIICSALTKTLQESIWSRVFNPACDQTANMPKNTVQDSDQNDSVSLKTHAKCNKGEGGEGLGD
jgi:hypothetical protein